jgi:hypothetical protein
LTFKPTWFFLFLQSTYYYFFNNIKPESRCWLGGFWQEDFLNFSQSEHVIGPGSHVEFPIYTKNTNLVEDHPMNIYGKFGWNLFSGFREEELNVWFFLFLQSTYYYLFNNIKPESRWKKKKLLFSSPGHRPCELLSWVSVRCPSVSFSHLTLLH